MKRKKWSEVEEQTLIAKYADLQNSGNLSKLKTREKKFKPIADDVNAGHHQQDPTKFPFKWTWRDVSIKIQNMRHQYLGVKQKIRDSATGEFNWIDADNHWDNFMRYKEVFGDIELEIKEDFSNTHNNYHNDGEEDGFGFEGVEEEMGLVDKMTRKGKRGFVGRRLGELGERVLELREVVGRREERRREREWRREEEEEEMEEVWDKGRDFEDDLDLDLAGERGKRVLMWERMEREFEEERRRRRKVEEKWEEEEMEWRERMVKMQMDHDKAMMRMHADACVNQMQVLGVMARVVCQFFGTGGDGLVGGLGGQVLHHHPGGGLVGDGGKPDASSPSEFL